MNKNLQKLLAAHFVLVAQAAILLLLHSKYDKPALLFMAGMVAMAALRVLWDAVLEARGKAKDEDLWQRRID